jgi:hypothetical protein
VFAMMRGILKQVHVCQGIDAVSVSL